MNALEAGVCVAETFGLRVEPPDVDISAEHIAAALLADVGGNGELRWRAIA